MKRMMLGVILMVFSLSACGSADGDRQSPETPAPSLPPATASPTDTAPPKLESLIIAPGGVGPLEVGMTTAEALATNVVNKPIPVADDPCEPRALDWLDSYDDALDVWTSQSGKIVSIGVFKPGPRTVEGIGIGSTLAEVSDAYENAEMLEAGFDQTGVFVTDGDRWLGFLFDAKLDDISRTSTVHFMEVSGQEKPSLIRSGC